MSATPVNPADALDAIRAGYSLEEPALDVGVALAPAADASDAAAAGSANAAASPTTPDPTAPIRLPLGMMNRHGLIAGATGTGKTVTLQVLAEQLSRAGVPVFASDIKGDLSGLRTTPSSRSARTRSARTGPAADARSSSRRWAGSARASRCGRP